jgi:hypothetical protein
MEETVLLWWEDELRERLFSFTTAASSGEMPSATFWSPVLGGVKPMPSAAKVEDRWEGKPSAPLGEVGLVDPENAGALEVGGGWT